MPEEARKELDALDLLMQDHRELESLFSEFDYLREKGEDTAGVMESACAEIKSHDILENDVFYPAVSDAAGDEEIETLLDDAEDMHDRALDLIEQLEQIDADVETRNAHFKLLADGVKQHILQEEAQLFPKVKKLRRLDLVLLASQMKTRRSQMMEDVRLTQTREASAS